MYSVGAMLLVWRCSEMLNVADAEVFTIVWLTDQRLASTGLDGHACKPLRLDAIEPSGHQLQSPLRRDLV